MSLDSKSLISAVKSVLESAQEQTPVAQLASL